MNDRLSRGLTRSAAGIGVWAGLVWFGMSALVGGGLSFYALLSLLRRVPWYPDGPRVLYLVGGAVVAAGSARGLVWVYLWFERVQVSLDGPAPAPAPRSSKLADGVAALRVRTPRRLRPERLPAPDAPVGVFLSYARAEFYFADAVREALEQDGVDAWMDVHRIAPGADWDARIRSAIVRCEALVLVVSPAAMTSSNVEEEWRLAHSLGTPVHVVLAHRASLPEELRPGSAWDLRTWFEQGAHALAAELRGGPATPPSGRRLRSLQLPAPVSVLLMAAGHLALLAASLVEGGLLGWHAFAAAPPGQLQRVAAAGWQMSVLGGLWLLQAGLALWAFRALLDRRFRAMPMVAVGPLVAFAAWYALEPQLVEALLWVRGEGAPWWEPDLYLRSLLWKVLVLNVLASAVAFWAPGFRRWLPTGESLRPFAVQPPAVTSLTAGSPLPFAVHYDAEVDADAAGELRMLLGSHGPPDGGHPEALQFLVISADTRRIWIQKRLEAFGARAICVFATAVRLPDDLPALTHRQWVDYRDRSPATLDGLTRLLTGADTAAHAPSVPERLERPRTPFGVLVLFAALTLVGSPALGTGLGALQFTPAPERIGAVPVIAGNAVLTAMTGAALLALAVGLVHRRLSGREFLAGYVVALLAVVYIGGTPLVGFWSDAEGLTDLAASTGLLIVALVAGLEGAARWLPYRLRRRRPEPGTLGRPGRPRRWLAFITVTTAFWFAAVQQWAPCETGSLRPECATRSFETAAR